MLIAHCDLERLREAPIGERILFAVEDALEDSPWADAGFDVDDIERVSVAVAALDGDEGEALPEFPAHDGTEIAFDPEEFADPWTVDLDREGVTRHVAFSAGPRVCPGANLSRVEQQIAWGVLLDRLDHIEYGDDNDWMHQPGIMLGTLKLNLRFTKSAEPLNLGTGRNRI